MGVGQSDRHRHLPQLTAGARHIGSANRPTEDPGRHTTGGSRLAGVHASRRSTVSNQPQRTSPSGRSKRVTTGLTSTTGVPSTRSTPATRIVAGPTSTIRTRLKPIGLTRRGPRIANIPTARGCRPKGKAPDGEGHRRRPRGLGRPSADQPREVELDRRELPHRKPTAPAYAHGPCTPTGRPRSPAYQDVGQAQRQSPCQERTTPLPRGSRLTAPSPPSPQSP
ncbi:MAG: hypothetical protein QOF81_3328 [Acidimicrobiaceae bacterium]|nr:hypothetical protein [Acidimicrobiaceae bacterium]